MPASIPLLRKSQFLLDARPLVECSSPRAGALSVSRVLRSLGLPALVEANVSVKQRQRGCDEAQYVESLVMLHAVGGDCDEDMAVLAADPCLERGLGYVPPQPDATRKFLDAFHDRAWEAKRPQPEVQKTFFPAPTASLEGLHTARTGLVQRPRWIPARRFAGLHTARTGLVQRVARRYAEQGQEQRMATLDADATIIEAAKRDAKWTYEGTRGYQPLVVVWAELDQVVADEFREGNVPARQQPLPCVQAGFAALPAGITERYFRGDSACHENRLIGWLNHVDRAAESGGAIGFVISAMLSGALAGALRAVSEKQWQTCGTEADGTLRQWAEVAFVPGPATSTSRRGRSRCGTWGCGCSSRRGCCLPTAATATTTRW